MPSPLSRPLLVGLLVFASTAPLKAAVSGSWTSLGPEGSEVLALASPADNPKVVYAGGNGGLYKSVDGGATWSRADRGLNVLDTVFTLAIDPLHSSTLYAGQQEGLFKSVDGGATWKQIHIASSPFHFGIRSLAIHPRFPETVFVGTDLGLYQSLNGGAKWRLLTRGLPPAPSQAFAVVIDPTSPRRMFASILELTSFQQMLFSSLDGGFSWQQVQSDLPAIYLIQSLVIDPRSPRSLWAVAVTQGVLFRSTNGGRNWTPALQTNDEFFEIVTLAFPPAQRSLIYAGGAGGLFRSLDGGATWSSLSQGLPSGVGISSLVVSANRTTTLIVGVTYPPRDTGLYKSTDGGTSWTRSDRGLTNSFVTSLALDAEDSNTLWVAALFRLFKSTDRGRTWSRSPMPLGIGGTFLRSVFNVILSPADPETVYLGLIDGEASRSRDGGQNWVGINNPLGNPFGLKADPLDAATLWASGAGLQKSTDRGDTWTSLPLPSVNAAFFDLAFSPSSPSTVYAGGFAGDSFTEALLLRSDDAGATWTVAQAGLPTGIRTLAVDPQHSETVYTVNHLGGDIYKTVNGGSTWSVVNNVFHNRNVDVLAAAPSGILYAAVEADNVYESEDGGLSWAPLGESPRPSGFSSLVADPKDPCRIYAATQNQGLLTFTKTGTAVCP